MRQFLEELYTTGELTVPGAGVEFDTEPIDDEIRKFDQFARLSMAHQAPALDLETARWAATLLAWAVRLLLVRTFGEQTVAQAFETPCPRTRSEASPEVDYSADLFLRHFPGLATLAKRLAPGDPLVEKIHITVAAWPLSSVGMDDVVPGSIESFIRHPGLRQLYVDRILAAGATARVNHPLVAQTILASVGAHPELSPELVKAAQEIAASNSK